MKYITILITVLILFSMTVSAQEKSDTTKTMHNMMHKKEDMKKSDSASKHHMNHDKMPMPETDMKESSMVHEGTIDLHVIDKNGDKKVYQDPMDWNVISDKSGECPLCGMKLKEVTIDEAKANLKKHGYKVKEDMQK